MKYIIRVLSNRVDGYQVRLPEIENGKMVKGTKEKVNRLFSLSHYKGLKGCLAAAKKWRDAHLKTHKALALLDEARVNKVGVPMESTGRNVSGAIGVSLAEDITSTSVLVSYKAQWRLFVDGKFKSGTRQFSIAVHGECSAFRQACAVRHEFGGEIIIKDVDAIPCFPDVPYRIVL